MSEKKILVNFLESHQGEPVAILCQRYWYRGILASYDSDHVLLSNPRAVEITGPATGSAPQSEDVIPSDLLISLAGLEIICQPTWVFHDVKDSKKKGNSNG